MPLAGLILAAGGSTRMGRPKQLLTYRGQSLMRRAAETALALPLHEIVVVLGSRADQIRPELQGLPLTVALNSHWESGMGSSIACGMANISQDCNAVLILLVDQPHVTPALLEEMIFAYRQGAHLVATSYQGTLGVPALFGRPFFKDLMDLTTQAGARGIIHKHEASAKVIPFAAGAIDVDTPEDYEQLKQEEP